MQAADGLPLILIGGHATMTWARAYELEPVGTNDLDWQTSSPSDLDVYAERAKVLQHTKNGSGFHAAVMTVPGETEDAPFIIDFLTSVHGVKSKELEEWAVPLSLFDTTIRVMHPVHLVVSRIKNLSIPTRIVRAPTDLAQARVAIAICTRYLSDTANKEEVLTRPARKQLQTMAEELWRLAKSIEGKRARSEHGLNPFDPVQAWPSMDSNFIKYWYPYKQSKLEPKY